MTEAALHLQRAADLLRQAAGELHIAAQQATHAWAVILLELRRRVLALGAELADALALLSASLRHDPQCCHVRSA